MKRVDPSGQTIGEILQNEISKNAKCRVLLWASARTRAKDLAGCPKRSPWDPQVLASLGHAFQTLSVEYKEPSCNDPDEANAKRYHQSLLPS